MMWLVATIESSIGWPTQDTTIEYLERNFTLRPESRTHFADVITGFESESHVDVEFSLREFCSMVAWVEDGSVSVLSVRISDEEPPSRSERPPKVVHGAFPSFVPVSLTADTKLMLALYREALAVNSPLFSFFGFFKILNTKLTGDEQKDWIDKNLHRLAQEDAVVRVHELTVQGKAVGAHIYNDLRMAVIHASENHNINPDDPKAISMLSLDLPLMRALAELFIEDFTIASTTTLP